MELTLLLVMACCYQLNVSEISAAESTLGTLLAARPKGERRSKTQPVNSIKLPACISFYLLFTHGITVPYIRPPRRIPSSC